MKFRPNATKLCNKISAAKIPDELNTSTDRLRLIVSRSARTACALLCLGIASQTTAAPPSIYDNFTSSYLNIKKWTPLFVPLYAQEWRREQRGGTLRLYVRGTPGSQKPSLIGGHQNILNGVALPAAIERSVRSIQVELVIASAEVKRCSDSRAEISEGMFLMSSSWFNDGTATSRTDQRGDIRTSISVSHNSGSLNELNIIAQVYRWDGTNLTEQARGFLGKIGFGKPVIIRTTWDAARKRFVFYRRSIELGESLTFRRPYTSFVNTVKRAGNSFHTLQARAEPAYCGAEPTHAEIDVRITQARISTSASGN